MTEEERVFWINENSGKRINKNFGIKNEDIVDDTPRVALVKPTIKDMEAETRL